MSCTFTPADIKGLLAEIYMYTDHEYLGGDDPTINPGLLHVVLTNWVGRGSHPIAMDSTVGEEVWNYPIYSFASSSAKRGENKVEVKVNVGYMRSTNREYQQSPRNKAIKYLHYTLNLDDEGNIIGGQYHQDSSRIDILWAPINPCQGGTEGNERGCPYIDTKEVLAIWRESVPEELRMKWFNIDPPPEDQIHPEGEELADAEPVADEEMAEVAVPDAEASGEESAVARNVSEAAVDDDRPTAPQPIFRRRVGLFGRRR